MLRLIWLGLVLSQEILVVLSHGEGDHRHYQPRPDHGEDLIAKRLREDREHLKEDIAEFLNLNPKMVEHSDPKQLAYFYFELHDFDKNKKLDGWEMMCAVMHVLEHQNNEGTGASFNLTAESLHRAIDQVLELDDRDQDGYLSYAEYVTSQQQQQKEQPSE